MSPRADHIIVPAFEIRQSKGRKLYSFVIDGKQIHSFATVSRLKRGTDAELEGYQRPEVLSHIEEIRSYLESSSPMIPNGIVVCFDTSVRFTPTTSTTLNTSFARMGSLRIPLPKGPTDAKPGFIVDGQQRVAAIREAQIRHFPIVVTAFITDDLSQQTEQFILVNSTKPLPKGLLYELLPSTAARLPVYLHKRRLSTKLLQALNYVSHSPMRNMIQAPTNPKGRIKDNSILRMLDHSLTDGILFGLRRKKDGEPDLQVMTDILFAFWWAVQEVFPESWDLPPKNSRLTHGAGIISVGNLMDHIGLPTNGGGGLRAHFTSHLLRVKPFCAWTEGTWKFYPTSRPWNDIQNTHQDVALLTDFLQRQYDTAKTNERSPHPAHSTQTA